MPARRPSRSTAPGELPVGATTPDGGTVVAWHREDLVEVDGAWYFARDLEARLTAARAMLAAGQRPSPVLALVDTGEHVTHRTARRPDGSPVVGRRYRPARDPAAPPAVAGRRRPPAQPRRPAPLRDPRPRARAAAHPRPATSSPSSAPA